MGELVSGWQTLLADRTLCGPRVGRTEERVACVDGKGGPQAKPPHAPSVALEGLPPNPGAPWGILEIVGQREVIAQGHSAGITHGSCPESFTFCKVHGHGVPFDTQDRHRLH